MLDDTLSIRLPYGQSGVFADQLRRQRVVLFHRPRKASANFRQELARALEAPLEFPPLRQVVVPGDRVTIVADEGTPQLAEVIAGVGEVLLAAGIESHNIVIVQPARKGSAARNDPRALLPPSERGQVQWVAHDPHSTESCAYLASTAGGERIYLSRSAVDADAVILVGPVAFDDVLGYRGTSSSLFPGLSDAQTQRRFCGQGHEELGPDDSRPMRQMVDEVGWLLGNQFSVAVIAGPGAQAAGLIVGQTDAVFREGRKLVQQQWQVEVEQRVELALLAVDRDACGHGWQQVCQAVEVGRRIVERDGKIVILSQLAEEPGDGLKQLTAVQSPREAIRPLRESAAADAADAIRMARALDWANVYLLSDLDPGLVEDLFVIPLTNPTEVSRVVQGDDMTAVICGAQHVHARCLG